jgi:hypothetical protein
LKKHPKNVFAEDIWQEIEFIFWRERIPCLPSGTTPDGVEPVFIETTKRGVEISGTMSFLPTGSYDLNLCLSRPGFSTIESVGISKLRRATIIDSCLENRALKITVTDTLTTTDETLLA